MRTHIIVREHWRVAVLLCVVVALAVATPSTVYVQGPGGPAGIDIKIRAQNRSTTDTPFCGVGGGMVGDRLDVDAFMDTNGFVTGTARFEDANGVVTVIPLDTLFTYFGGVLVQNAASENSIPIWMGDTLPTAALVNVELPRGCSNTVSTFTPGVDKLTVEIKYR